MSPEVQQMGTLVKALSPYYSKMELLEALYWQEKELHHHYQWNALRGLQEGSRWVQFPLVSAGS